MPIISVIKHDDCVNNIYKVSMINLEHIDSRNFKKYGKNIRLLRYDRTKYINQLNKYIIEYLRKTYEGEKGKNCFKINMNMDNVMDLLKVLIKFFYKLVAKYSRTYSVPMDTGPDM